MNDEVHDEVLQNIFYIWDNCGLPFKVVNDTNKTIVQIFNLQDIRDWKTNEITNDNLPIYDKMILETKYKIIYTGEKLPDDLISLYKFEPGNAILLYLGNRKYIFIGCKIYSFKLARNEKVFKFISPIGNSGISYPYLITNKNTYLFNENIYLDNTYFQFPDTYNTDPYYKYYEYYEYYIKKIKSIKILNKFY